MENSISTLYNSFPLLKTTDFPPHYENFIHPEDFKPYDTKVEEKFSYRGNLFIRLSFNINGKFFPITFVCDRKRPKGIYLTSYTRRILDPCINTTDFGFDCAHFKTKDGKSCHILVDETNQPQVNFFGIKLD